MDVGAINSVLISGSVAAIVGIILYMLPVRSQDHTPGRTVDARLSALEGRYDELKTENARLRNELAASRDELTKKIVAHADAYLAWNKRESEYIGRIKSLEQQLTQLRARMRDVETATGVEHDETDLVVLGVWPDAGLNVNAEADALYNAGYNYRALRGDKATRTGIIRELDRLRGHRIIVEVGAHGTADGTILYGGDVVEPIWWRRRLVGRGVELVVLLSCNSDEVGDALVAGKVPAVISMSGDVPDDEAVLFVRELYAHLAEHDSIHDAVDYARDHVSRNAWEMIRYRGD